MEKYLLADFQSELSQIKDYIKHIQQVNDLVEIEIPDIPVFHEFKTHFLSFRNDKKLFEYKAIIISLYGLLEKYIDLWIQEYLFNLSRLVSYDKLLESFRNRHFELSMKLIEVISKGQQPKFNRLKREDVLRKLNNCIVNPTSYELNVEAFTIQTGNLKHSRIEDKFKLIDIIISKELIKDTELITLTGLSTDQIQNTESSVLFGKIDELVERRNILAHGAKIDDLLDLSTLKPYIDFFEKYCVAVYRVLEEKDIENHTIEKYSEVFCKSVLKNKSIIAVSIENYSIKIGTSIIIKTASHGREHFYKKTIKSLGKDGKNDYQELKIEEKIDIAIGIENQEMLPITTQCMFYLLNNNG